MRAIDARNETWQGMMNCFAGLRKTVYQKFMLYGPCTTRRLAELSGIDLLTVRPRTTELIELGFVVMIGSDRGNGIYKAIDFNDVEMSFNKKKREKESGQMYLFPAEEVA